MFRFPNRVGVGRRLSRCPWALLMALGTSGCADVEAGADASDTDFTLRDSAGIAIVENGPVASAPVYETEDPLVDIGALDGPEEYLLSGAGAVALLDDGGVAIGDGSRSIRFFGPDGRYRGSFGREGDGPGEFQFPRAVWQRDDGALVVLDGRHWRLTVIRDGELESTHPIRPPGMNPPETAAMLADGSVVVREMLFRIPDSGFEPVPAIVRRITLDEAPPDTVLRGDGPRFGPVRYSDGGSIITTPLFETGLTVAAAGGTLLASRCDAPQYRELTPEGTLRRIVRWETGDRSVAPEDVAAVREAALAEDETAEERRRTEEYYDARPVNETFPACGGLHAGPGGSVWVMAYAASRASPQTWHVFHDGRLTGTMVLPPSSFLVDLGSERVAVLERDELDVEHVRVYEVPEPLRLSDAAAGSEAPAGPRAASP